MVCSFFYSWERLYFAKRSRLLERLTEEGTNTGNGAEPWITVQAATQMKRGVP